MNAAEADHVKPAGPDAAASATGSDRSLFALSIRERRGVIAAADFAIGALAALIAFTYHPGKAHSLPALDILTYGAIWIIALLIADGYAFQVPSSRMQSGIAVVKALPIAVLLAVLTFFLRPYVLNRTIVVLALAIGTVLLILMRTTIARLLLHESLAVRAIFLSDTEPSAEMTRTLHAARFECRVMATLTASAKGNAQGTELLAETSELLKRYKAHELIVASNQLRLIPGLAEECLNQGVRVVSGGDLVERYMGRVPIDSIDVHWYLGLPDNDLLERPYALLRRVGDLLLSFVLSLPFLILLPFLALAIKLESAGPIFHSQRRIGEHGQEFSLLKLRTMVDNAEAEGPRYTEVKDPRVTRLGRLLRATHLDEFPQLLNIVRGDMSFIGPRPERPEFVADLEARIPHFRSRLMIKPGLTGWAQIKGGYASTTDEMTRKVEYDLYYIKNRSLRLDLQILAGTFITMVGRRGY